MFPDIQMDEGFSARVSGHLTSGPWWAGILLLFVLFLSAPHNRLASFMRYLFHLQKGLRPHSIHVYRVLLIVIYDETV